MLRSRFSGRDPLLQDLIIGQLATVAGAFLINVLSARAMGPENRGEIALILQLSYVAGAVVPLGRDRAALQAGFDRSLGPQVRTILFELARTPIGILVGVGLVFGVWRYLLDGSMLMTLGFVLLLVGNLASRFFRVAAIIERRGTRFLICTALGQVGLVFAGGSLLVAGISAVTSWLLVYGAALALPFLVALAIRGARRAASDQELGASPDLRRTKRLGLGFLPSELLNMMMTKADKLVLPVLSSYATMGYYTVAVSLVDFSLMPFSQYIDSRIPTWAELHRRGELRLRAIMLRPLAVAAVVVAAVAFASYWAIPLLFGREYLPAREILPWLALSTLCHVTSNFCAGVAVAIGTPGVLFWMRSVGIGVILPLLVVLIPSSGAVGAAVAQASGFGGSALVGIILMRKAAGASRQGESE